MYICTLNTVLFQGLKESLNTLVKEYPSGVTLSYFDIIKELCIEDLCIHIEVTMKYTYTTIIIYEIQL